ncbi:MAG: aminotransferase class III-fold pyridoxal phosphate-dependent enzyme [Bacteroidales bacterium]|nr:aminotransferase class III-fold pyridoxal phosphate-dependent enzyme [Bacteroidales bacterium]
MELFDVYALFDVEPVKREGCYVYDDQGNKYLDLYGGHAVISIGHSHPLYVQKLTDQLSRLGFYSNSVKNSLQKELAYRLGLISGYEDYSLFVCNSGAEANENALKLASFHTGKGRVIAFRKAFHGRTHGAVTVTDNPKIVAPVNHHDHVTFIPLNDAEALDEALQNGDVCAVIIEGIQGVAGINCPDADFLVTAKTLCEKYGALLILDEVQSGYGRSGKFFAHQYAGIRPDIITVAKGMGNGFPIAGVLISPQIKPSKGMLGTTFGGNHLACAAGLAVLEVMEKEHLIENALATGNYLKEKLSGFKEIKQVKGMGLMLGLEFNFPIAPLRSLLVQQYKVFTGSSGNENVMRLLPPLSLTIEQADQFMAALSSALTLLFSKNQQ